MRPPARPLKVRALTPEAFAPFGEVIGTDGAHSYPINGGTTTRFHELAGVELAGVEAGEGRAILSIFRGQPFAAPITLTGMERHPLGSQAFVALGLAPFLVVVAPDADGRPGRPLAFLVQPGGVVRGVNYRTGVWHHPLLALKRVSDFLVVDRAGEGGNLEEAAYSEPWVIDTTEP